MSKAKKKLLEVIREYMRVYEVDEFMVRYLEGLGKKNMSSLLHLHKIIFY